MKLKRQFLINNYILMILRFDNWNNSFTIKNNNKNRKFYSNNLNLIRIKRILNDILIFLFLTDKKSNFKLRLYKYTYGLS